MTTCSSIFAWKIAWTEEPGGLLSMGVTKSWTWLSDWVHAHVCVRAHTHTHTTRLQVSTMKTQLSTKGHTSSICCHCCLLLATLKFGSVTCNPAKQWELEDGVQLSSLHLWTGHILSSMSFFSPHLWRVILSQWECWALPGPARAASWGWGRWCAEELLTSVSQPPSTSGTLLAKSPGLLGRKLCSSTDTQRLGVSSCHFSAVSFHLEPFYLSSTCLEGT